MIRSLLRAVAENLAVLLALIFVSCTLPFATCWLVRDPIGMQVCFWAGPWVVAFWSVVLYISVGARFWRGRMSVEEWKIRHGSYLWRAVKSTVWMFAALAFSYGCEAALLFLTRSPGWTAAGAYVPVGFTLVWSGIRG